MTGYKKKRSRFELNAITNVKAALCMSNQATESFQCKAHKGNSEIWVRAAALYSHAAVHGEYIL